MLGNISIYWSNFVGNNSKTLSVLLLCTGILYSKLILVSCQWELWHLFCYSEVKVTQSCLTLCNTMYYTVHGILQARILEWVAFPFSRGSSQPKDQTALQADSLPAGPQAKPKNTGVSSLSLLQGIFPTQKLNWGLLHCRQILYQLSYQGGCRYRLCYRVIL